MVSILLLLNELLDDSNADVGDDDNGIKLKSRIIIMLTRMMMLMTRMIMMSTGPSATARVAGGVAVVGSGGQLRSQRRQRGVVAGWVKMMIYIL